MTNLVLSFQQTESTMAMVADWMLEATALVWANPRDLSSSKQTVGEGPMLMTHATIFLSPIVLQILCLI